jgi:hypothetical protein
MQYMTQLAAAVPLKAAGVLQVLTVVFMVVVVVAMAAQALVQVCLVAVAVVIRLYWLVFLYMGALAAEMPLERLQVAAVDMQLRLIQTVLTAALVA